MLRYDDMHGLMLAQTDRQTDRQISPHNCNKYKQKIIGALITGAPFLFYGFLMRIGNNCANLMRKTGLPAFWVDDIF